MLLWVLGMPLRGMARGALGRMARRGVWTARGWRWWRRCVVSARTSVRCSGRWVRCGCGVWVAIGVRLGLGDGGVQLQGVVGDADQDGARLVSVFSRLEEPSEGLGEKDGWTRHASGVLAPDTMSALAGMEGLDGLGGVWPPQDA